MCGRRPEGGRGARTSSGGTWPQYATEISRPRRGGPPRVGPPSSKVGADNDHGTHWPPTLSRDPPASVTKWPHMHASGTSAGPASDIYSEHRVPFPTQAVLHATPRAQGSAAATLSRHPRRSHMGCARELHEAMAGPADPASTLEEGLSFLASINSPPCRQRSVYQSSATLNGFPAYVTAWQRARNPPHVNIDDGLATAPLGPAGTRTDLRGLPPLPRSLPMRHARPTTPNLGPRSPIAKPPRTHRSDCNQDHLPTLPAQHALAITRARSRPERKW
ncbi:hypothetical protein DE4576_04866 [Mycobacterium marinum]|nr:hypothetical protein DE4576_04866 [Mycobacterium marinum]